MVRRTPNRKWSLFDRSACSDCPKSLSSPNTEQSEHIFFDSEQGEQSELPLKFDVFLRLSKLFQKYNLLFFGLAEEPDEDPEQLVRNILQTKMDIILKDKDIEFAEVRLFWWQKIYQIYKLFQRKPDTKSNPPPILVKFQRWKDKTKIFYKRKILPAQYMIDEDLTPKQTYDKSKLEAYAKMVSILY